MIYTLTLNPAIDKTITLYNLEKYSTNVSENETINLGGKGINLSIILNTLKIKNKAICVFGTNNYNLAEKEIKKMKLDTINIFNENTSIRENIKIHERQTSKTTEINSKGSALSLETINKIPALIDTVLEKNDIIIFSGSTPPNIPDDIYYNLIKISNNKGCTTILDTSGRKLEEGIKAKPCLIKPNQDEFNYIFPFNHDEAINNIISKGIKILLTKGRNGLEYITSDVKIIKEAIRVSHESTVGAGDSLLGGYIAGLVQGFTEDECLNLGLACAAARISKGINLSYKDIMTFYKK